jgi:sterol desaturase/sphingolipid hydroxylase (fatty acid hydroxylase superfamily)
MGDGLIVHEGAVRLGCFLAVMVLMLSWERAAPRRAQTPRRGRWFANFALVAVDAALLRMALPAAAVGAALLAAEHGVGALNHLSIPPWCAVLITIIVLDFAVWAQHVAVHKLPIFWRMHRVHHSDIGFDTTTAVRFHPFEILLSMLYKMTVVAILGAPAAGVMIFEVLLNASALFNHGNVRLSLAIDRVIRVLVVTPDMHRVHHSIRQEETDSNYGFCLSIWDRLFGTYRAAPRDDHEKMMIGLRDYRAPDEQRLVHLLLLPFRHTTRGSAPVSRAADDPNLQSASTGAPSRAPQRRTAVEPGGRFSSSVRRALARPSPTKKTIGDG